MNFASLLLIGFFGICLTQDIVKQRVYVGQSVKLKCGPISRFVNIPMKFQWEKPIGTVIGSKPILTLSSVDFNDGGTYTCRVTHTINNKVQEKVLSTQLLIKSRDSSGNSGGTSFPTDSPNINFKPVTTNNRIELVETQYLYMECIVNNWQMNEYTVRWMKDGKIVGKPSKTLFKFPVTAESDSGSYFCEVRHNSASQQVYQRQLYVNIKKPQLKVESLPGESLKLGGRVYRKCKIDTTGQVEYSWIKDGVTKISDTDLLDVDIRDVGANGRYTCVVKSPSGGLKYESTITIRVDTGAPVAPDSITINLYTNPMYPEVNKPFQLTCEIFPPQPNVIYKWRKDNQIVYQGRQYTISSFKKSDVGKYTCEAQLAGGAVIGGSPLSKKNNVDIKFQLSTSNKIELEEDGSQMISREGDKRELHCELSGNSNIKGKDVIWFFNNRRLDSYSQRTYNIYRENRLFVSILSLNSVSLANEGQYKCEVNGVVKTANLIVLRNTPLLAVNPAKIEIFEGEPAEFHCRVNNIPNVMNNQLTWSFKERNGNVRSSITDTRSSGRSAWTISNTNLTPETSFILLENCRVADSGFYICTTPSGLSRTAELIVKPRNEPATVTVTPKEVRTRPGKPITIECFSVSMRSRQPYGNPKFSFTNGRSLVTDRRMNVVSLGNGRVRLSIPNGLSQSDNGLQVNCQLSPGEGSGRDSSTIYVEDQCPPSYRRCNNGQCLPAARFCDGRVDCNDRSDEDPSVCNKCEPLRKKCEIANGRSPLKKTYLIHWECDGENDCGNGFDESNCANEISSCGSLQFKCNNGKMIPNAYRCDKENDCSTNEDEYGCRNPQITSQSSQTAIRRIRVGASVNLTCESRGFPRPRIAWRQNWGCLRDNRRMIVSTVLYRAPNGLHCDREVSTLQIMSFRSGDDGVYNCEGISGTSRAFSDDFQLILDRN